VTGEDRAGLLRLMALARATERRARTLVEREDCASPAARRHREAIGAGAVVALDPRDRLIAPGRYLAAHLGRDEESSVGGSSPAPDLVPVAVGAALAIAARGSKEVVLTLLDEGAMSGDRWAESFALATAKRLPLVLVVEQERAAAQGAPAASGSRPLGQPPLGEAVDADDPEAVLTAVRSAVDRARGGRAPAMVACVAGAGPGVAASPSPGQETREATDADPVERYARRMLGIGVPRAEIESVLRSAEEEAIPWRP
jgi:pyruvate dehydrogenase E1 component alpha subunit